MYVFSLLSSITSLHITIHHGHNGQGGSAPMLGCLDVSRPRDDGPSHQREQFQGVLGARVQRELNNIERVWVQ